MEITIDSVSGETRSTSTAGIIDYGQHHYGCQCYSCAARTYTGTVLWLTSQPTEMRLSDDDVKRIAREVVRLMRADGHDPGDEDLG